MKFDAQELTVIGTLAGAFIGGLFGFLTAWISKRSEERKSFSELIARIASEQYLHEIDAKQKGGGGYVLPYQVYLVNVLQLAKIINRRRLTPKRLNQFLAEGRKLVDVVVEYSKPNRKSPAD